MRPFVPISPLTPEQTEQQTTDDRRAKIAELLQVPDLEDKVFDRVNERVRQRSIILGQEAVAPTASPETEQFIKDGLEAAKQVQSQPDTPLTPPQTAALESVILIMNRPALLVQKNDFPQPNPIQPWGPPLDQERPSIKQLLPSVGRIEIVVGGLTQVVATGFMVGDGLIMTNRHVVEDIATRPDNNSDWQLVGGRITQINFAGEYNISEAPPPIPIQSTDIWTHPSLDIGFLRIQGDSLPPLLKVASDVDTTQQQQQVYAVGHPASDNEGVIPAAVLKDIFDGHYGFKRLSPGLATNFYPAQGVFAHDCSTLGGSSGSCVVDMVTGMIFGLHYSGSYMKSNFAVSLWSLKDSLPAEYRVNFD